MALLNSKWFKVAASMAVAGLMYVLAAKFPKYGSELAALAALACPSLLAAAKSDS